VGVMGWKVASGEVKNLPMLNRMAATHLPVMLSTGMSPLSEIDEAVELLRERGVKDLTVMQCTSSYPTPPEKVGLNLLPVLRERYRCDVGLSDHSGTIWPSLSAVTLGASVIEVHVTFSKDAFGPDVPSSVTMEDLKRLVEGVRFLERARAHPVDKDVAARELEPMRKLFTKSVVARRALAAGTVLNGVDLTAKKPGTGIPADRLHSLVGRRLARDVAADAVLMDEDLEA
jgi:N,N'-diacetyllegionaminate synthase